MSTSDARVSLDILSVVCNLSLFPTCLRCIVSIEEVFKPGFRSRSHPEPGYLPAGAEAVTLARLRLWLHLIYL